jgi:hypothetical protein
MMTPMATLNKQLESIKNFEILPVKNHIQTDVDNKHRAIVVDWLFEVSNKWEFFDDTIHYAVSYMDRYLFLKHQEVGTLQLLGATCMWIAAKYNEIYPPDLSDFVYIAADTYSKELFLRMEANVLSALNFELSKPTTKTFLMHCSNKEINYQVDLSLMSPPDSLPSTQATNILKKRKRFEEPRAELRGIREKYQKYNEKMKYSAVKKMVSIVIGNVVKLFA